MVCFPFLECKLHAGTIRSVVHCFISVSSAGPGTCQAVNKHSVEWGNEWMRTKGRGTGWATSRLGEPRLPHRWESAPTGSWKPGSGAQESEGLQLWGSSVQARAPGRGQDRGDLPCQKRQLGYFGVTQMSAPLPQTLRESLESSQEFARVTRPLGDCQVS